MENYNSVQAVPAADNQVNRITAAMERAVALANRVENAVDFLLGCVPIGGSVEKEPPAEGLLNEMDRHARYLDERLRSAEQALGRLDKAMTR